MDKTSTPWLSPSFNYPPSDENEDLWDKQKQKPTSNPPFPDFVPTSPNRNRDIKKSDFKQKKDLKNELNRHKLEQNTELQKRSNSFHKLYMNVRKYVAISWALGTGNCPTNFQILQVIEGKYKPKITKLGDANLAKTINFFRSQLRWPTTREFEYDAKFKKSLPEPYTRGATTKECRKILKKLANFTPNMIRSLGPIIYGVNPPRCNPNILQQLKNWEQEFGTSTYNEMGGDKLEAQGRVFFDRYKSISTENGRNFQNLGSNKPLNTSSNLLWSPAKRLGEIKAGQDILVLHSQNQITQRGRWKKPQKVVWLNGNSTIKLFKRQGVNVKANLFDTKRPNMTEGKAKSNYPPIGVDLKKLRVDRSLFDLKKMGKKSSYRPISIDMSKIKSSINEIDDIYSSDTDLDSDSDKDMT